MQEISLSDYHKRESDAEKAHRDLLRQIGQKTFELGQMTVDLYQRGEIRHMALIAICDELLNLEKQTLEKTAEQPESLPSTPDDIQLVAQAPEPSAAAQPTTGEAQVEPAPAKCGQCGMPVRRGRKFCSSCGQPVELAATTSPLATPSSTFQPEPARTSDQPAAILTSAAADEAACAQCGAPLRPGATFCTACGRHMAAGVDPLTVTQVEQPTARAPASTAIAMPAVASPVTQFCENCGLGLAADVTVCPSCGGNKFS